MTSRVLVVAVCFAVVIASSALPAPRILPGQTLHLDQAQVRTVHRARLAAIFPMKSDQCLTLCRLTFQTYFRCGPFKTTRTTPARWGGCLGPVTGTQVTIYSLRFKLHCMICRSVLLVNKCSRQTWSSSTSTTLKITPTRYGHSPILQSLAHITAGVKPAE